MTPKQARERLFGELHPVAETEGAHVMAPLVEWSDSAVWDVWARPGLDIKQRSLVVCTCLAALNRIDLLEVHLRGALRVGWTVEELKEALLQLTVYSGAPAGTHAFSALSRIVGSLTAASAGEQRACDLSPGRSN